MSNIAIIGSGIAGLATAIRLAHKKHKVTVFEANPYPGGKLSVFNKNGYRFDAGPSLFTMPQFIEELFKEVNVDISTYFSYESLPVACHYFYEDQTNITAYTNAERFAQEVESKLGVDKKVLLAHLKHSQKLYETTASIFLEQSLHKLKNYFSTDVLKAIANIHQLNLTSSMHEVNERKLKHPHLVQLFDRFATYNGSSPYMAAGVLNIIPHLEHNIGTFFPHGGMHSITEALYHLALDLGVKFQFQSRITSIERENNRVIGVSAKKKFFPAEIVVSNMDIVPTYQKLLKIEQPPYRLLKQERSSSALIFYWGIKKQFPQLSLHNIFFSQDYKAEFDGIFGKGKLSTDPTVYINITSKLSPEDAPNGCENWFVMVNVPSNTGQNWSKITKDLRKQVLNKLSRMLGEPIAPLIATESLLDPRGIEHNTSSFQGSLYGTSSNHWLSAFLRHPNFSSDIEGLYFCGGSVHPGGGIPLCLLSAKITAGLIPNA